MAIDRPPPPFRQGDIDALCGIYAILNAIRLALGRDAGLDPEDWHFLFSKLLQTAEREIGSVRAVTQGIDTAPLWKLLLMAQKHVAKHHALTLGIVRPFHGRRRVPQGTILGWLAETLGQRGSSVIVGLGGELDHWTTAHRITAHYLTFYDSAGISRIRLDRCRREEIIDGQSIILLRLAQSDA